MISQPALQIMLTHRLAQVVDELAATAFHAADVEITPRQYVVLQSIRDFQQSENAKPNQLRLTAVTKIDRSTLSDVVRRLAAAELVKRVRNRNDARADLVGLTSKGRATLDRADRAASAVEADIANRNGVVHEALARINAAMKAK